jgi:hypothetical protein
MNKAGSPTCTTFTIAVCLGWHPSRHASVEPSSPTMLTPSSFLNLISTVKPIHHLKLQAVALGIIVNTQHMIEFRSLLIGYSNTILHLMTRKLSRTIRSQLERGLSNLYRGALWTLSIGLEGLVLISQSVVGLMQT